MGQNGPLSYDDLTQQIPATELSTLLRVSSSLASTLELSEVLQIAIESATELINLDTGAIYTLENESLYLGATTPPLPADLPKELRLANIHDHLHLREAITTKQPVFLEDARNATLSLAEKIVVDSRHLVSILYFPLLVKETAIGAFIVGTTRRIREFTDKEIDLCKILSFQVSLAVANAKLYAEAQQAIVDLTQAYDATLEGWSRVLDMRDHVTDEHTHRVADLTAELAKKMDISESELGDIHRGALLHDIGKMGIPDSILQKPDVLTETEWEIMQTHPELAYKFLSHISYLAPALDIPLCHHEKWDGTGYPRKLKGEQIPVAARIFAVVDVFDALTSDRPYRKAWEREKALEYIQQQSGKHFFPEAVEAFLKMVGEQ
jgi:HD-GYP domain-containing protein (c-di-GMP phosphodiesterase class II)